MQISVPEINEICIQRLNEYDDYITSKGASLAIAGYPIAYGKYATFDKKDFDRFQEELQEVVNCDVISQYSDYFYPYSYFYDTTLHLTEEAANIRTEQLISDLKRWMDSK